ncbi:hypothetical protein LXT21_20625 [Myxococcus sp. K38C18041901]|uniref:hypothetical protein n=1 Tax=Myxococcus guangdongensis TaxID=2906760 RepID=UPI0020A80DD2|nr:hypothetical protein [Myxococcus guangdongensis]MCP3061190.1 hypothetical protein [Myxococcus guangdongensis]
MKKYQCPVCSGTWRSARDSILCPCCPVPVRPPTPTQAEVAQGAQAACALCKGAFSVSAGQVALRCPSCAVALNAMELEQKAYNDSEREEVAESVPQDVRVLGPAVRQLMGQRDGSRRVLCLGCSKDISRVFLMTDGDDISMVSLDRNFTKQRLALFDKEWPHRVMATMLESKLSETVVLTPKVGAVRRLYVRLYDMGYDSFFARRDPNWRADVLVDKMSWLADCPTALAHALHCLKPGGFWISDVRFAPMADWMLRLMGLEAVTEQLPPQLRYKNWGFATVQLYKKTRDLPLADCLYAMFFWSHVFKSTNMVRTSLESTEPVGWIDLGAYNAYALLFEALLKSSPAPNEAKVEGVKWWLDTLKLFEVAVKTQSPPVEVKSPGVDEKHGSSGKQQQQEEEEVDVRGPNMASEFPSIGRAILELTAEQKSKPEDEQLNPLRVQKTVLLRLAVVGALLEGKGGIFKVIQVPADPQLMGAYRLKRVG